MLSRWHGRAGRVNLARQPNYCTTPMSSCLTLACRAWAATSSHLGCEVLRPKGRYVSLRSRGWGQAVEKAKAAAAGFDTHLVKPVAADELGRVLADACDP